ncbi:hypothetical protein QU38_00450, partial [Staphylococcus aureus]
SVVAEQRTRVCDEISDAQSNRDLTEARIARRIGATRLGHRRPLACDETGELVVRRSQRGEIGAVIDLFRNTSHRGGERALVDQPGAAGAGGQDIVVEQRPARGSEIACQKIRRHVPGSGIGRAVGAAGAGHH